MQRSAAPSPAPAAMACGSFRRAARPGDTSPSPHGPAPAAAPPTADRPPCRAPPTPCRLSKHPDVYEAANKGPHFWDECQWPVKGACTVPPTGDFEGYIRLFSKAAQSIASNPQGITGEASSNTFTSARGVYLRGFTGHKCV